MHFFAKYYDSRRGCVLFRSLFSAVNEKQASHNGIWTSSARYCKPMVLENLPN